MKNVDFKTERKVSNEKKPIQICLLTVLLLLCLTNPCQVVAMNNGNTLQSVYDLQFDPDELIIPTVELPNFPCEVQQQNNYCAPACTKMAIKYLTGTSYTQGTVAGWLGMTGGSLTNSFRMGHL